MPQLRILAQPNGAYRERYTRDIDPNLNRAQRFIQAEINPANFRYPTVEISREWFHEHGRYYIHLTACTIDRGSSTVRYIHPYPLYNEDSAVRKVEFTNSLYFPVTDQDLANGYKSLQFTKTKLPQHQLKEYGLLRKLNSDDPDEDRLDELPIDPKRMIEKYQLDQSELIFSVATVEEQNNSTVLYGASSVRSQVIIGNATSVAVNDDEITFRCVPQRGDQAGGDEIFLFLPRIDKRKAFTVHFIAPSGQETPAIELEFIDAKTISFRTPPCPVPITQSQPCAVIPIVVIQNNNEVARVPFTYQSLNYCLSCRSSLIASPQMNLLDYNQNFVDDYNETDEMPVTALNLTSQKNEETQHSGTQSYIDKARLICTIKSEDRFSALEDAIRSGDCDSAAMLISQSYNLVEQTNDQGDTPLLLAARFHRDSLLRLILKRRPELARQVDRHGNNLLHLLASVSSDRAKETITSILLMFDERTKETLMKQINQDQHTPEQVAQMRNNKMPSDNTAQ